MAWGVCPYQQGNCLLPAQCANLFVISSICYFDRDTCSSWKGGVLAASQLDIPMHPLGRLGSVGQQKHNKTCTCSSTWRLMRLIFQNGAFFPSQQQAQIPISCLSFYSDKPPMDLLLSIQEWIKTFSSLPRRCKTMLKSRFTELHPFHLT